MATTNTQKCAWCNLSDKEKQYLLFETSKWSIYLADIQDYIGRCILVLNRHCGSLSELSLDEWIDLKEIINQIEHCYKIVLGAELCNWSCLLNNFYKSEIPDPHLHIHVRPRYRQPIIINNHVYVDSEFGHHYAIRKADEISEEDKLSLFQLLKKFFCK